jgi:aspartyl-tRNA(Asn)/glutamyl-tRNA(Gln) amidotransferase subunit C
MLASGMLEGLTKVEVAHIAALARLDLTDDEKELYRRQLTEILEYARQLARLDTTDVAATSQVLAGREADRPDEARPSLPREDALGNAPEPARDAGLFKVPRVVG